MQLTDLDTLTGQLSSPWMLAAVAGVVLLGLLFVAVVCMRRRKAADARLMQKIIGRHAEAIEQDVTLSDGIDGYLFMDYLLLLPGKIIAMKTVSKKGYIFGAEDIDEWTCVENNRTGKFRNPLEDVRLSVHQIRHALDFDAVEGCVLFGRQSEFPKGVPEGVLRLAHLDEELAARHGDRDAQEAARDAWQRLVAMAHEDRQQLNAVLKP